LRKQYLHSLVHIYRGLLQLDRSFGSYLNNR
jgi:hypothetical protein